MNADLRTIEVDAVTAEVLEERAAERGVSVAVLVADLVAWDARMAPRDRDAGGLAGESASEAVAELDRRWTAVQAGEPTVPHGEVVRWLETWGTPAFRPWAER